jgi:hypothetical protein
MTELLQMCRRVGESQSAYLARTGRGPSLPPEQQPTRRTVRALVTAKQRIDAGLKYETLARAMLTPEQKLLSKRRNDALVKRQKRRAA